MVVAESLWESRTAELLDRTASAAPTPGGGSIAAVVGAFGIALIEMAAAVTNDPDLATLRSRLNMLRTVIEAAADGDVCAFAQVVAAYQMPHDDDIQQQSRSQQVELATITATQAPLDLAEALLGALHLAREVEPAVKPRVISDVLAGRDVITGALRAAIRSADINLDTLDHLSSPAAVSLHERRVALLARLDAMP
jgi:methenyltetrahydrofolate cyclohydrolase